MADVDVTLRYARLAPRKARAVIDLIRGKRVAWAESYLATVPRKAARMIAKLLHSGIAAAKAKKLVEQELSVTKAFVQEGPRLKRARSHFRGTIRPIDKQMSHITLVLSDERLDNEELGIKKKKRVEARQ